MFGIGPLELIVIAIFAIVFIGPQNLPQTLGKFAKFFVKARRYSSEIKVGFDDMVRKAENEMHLAEVESNLKELKSVGGIDEHSLKPLSTQNTSGLGKPDETQGETGQANNAPEPDDAELYAGLPSHLDGKPIHPSFDELGDSAFESAPEPEDKPTPEPTPEPSAEAKPKVEPAPSPDQPEPQEENHADHHAQMVKDLQDKLSDTKS